MRLGELLVMKGWVTQEHADAALKEQQQIRMAGGDEWLGQILLRHGHVDPEQLAAALAEKSLTWASE